MCVGNVNIRLADSQLLNHGANKCVSHGALVVTAVMSGAVCREMWNRSEMMTSWDTSETSDQEAKQRLLKSTPETERELPLHM